MSQVKGATSRVGEAQTGTWVDRGITAFSPVLSTSNTTSRDTAELYAPATTVPAITPDELRSERIPGANYMSTPAYQDPKLTRVENAGGATVPATGIPAVTPAELRAERLGSNYTEVPEVPEPEVPVVDPDIPPTYEEMVYSWDARAAEGAGADYDAAVAAARQDASEQSAGILAEGQELQSQAAMDQYRRNQSIEKAGWTGGYVLDQARQNDYMKAAINAQMYTAVELQKYGMDRQLDAAMAAYEQGKQELALQYYELAVQQAAAFSEFTGRWISAEQMDMAQQYTAAELTMQTAAPDTDEYARAQSIVNSVTEWFGVQGLTPEGIQAFMQLTMSTEERDRIWGMAAAFEEANAGDPSRYLLQDAEGNYVLNDQGQIVVRDLRTDDPAVLADYFATNDGAVALENYLNGLGAQTFQGYLATLEEGEEPTATGLNNYLAEEGNNLMREYIGQFGETDVMQYIAEAVDGEYSFSVDYTHNGTVYSIPIGQTEVIAEPASATSDEDTVILTDNNVSITRSNGNELGAPGTNQNISVQITNENGTVETHTVEVGVAIVENASANEAPGYGGKTYWTNDPYGINHQVWTNWINDNSADIQNMPAGQIFVSTVGDKTFMFIKTVGSNGKYDIRVVERAGVDPSGLKNIRESLGYETAVQWEK